MSRRIVLAAAGAAVLALAVGVVASSRRKDAGASEPAATALRKIERRDLVHRESLDGTLGYGPVTSVVAARGGTVTRAVPTGTVVRRGEALGELDGRPVPLMYGPRPAWRVLGLGVADGPDVRQVEENLHALRHDAGLPLVVDEKWDVRTTRAVRAWQASRGEARTGVLELGSVAFAPGAVRVAAHDAAVGAVVGPGAAFVRITGIERYVTVDLDARRQSLVKVGKGVQVVLPDGRSVAGSVVALGTAAEAPEEEGAQDAPATLELTVRLRDARAAGTLDAAPVEVRVAAEERKGVLTVPVNALVALVEGGYALELDRGGTRTLVPVRTGMFADGRVEVVGELDEGVDVVVPA